MLLVLYNNYTWFFYRGHGAVTAIDVDGSVSYDDGDFNLNGGDIDASTSQLYPMAFVFSCNSRNYGNFSTCFGERWIRSEQGGVSFLGATTTTRRHVNNVIIKKLFGDAFTDEEQLGSMVNLGMKRYWKRFWSFFSRKKTKRHMKYYNFYGDPSFNKSGNGCITDFVFDNNEVFHNGDSLTYQASNNIENNSSFVLNSGSSVTLIAGNSIKLNHGFKAEAGSIFKAYTAPCTNTTILKSGKVQDKNIKTTLFIDSIKTASLDLDVIAYPNPFSDNLSIRFCLNADDKVSISITNQLGIKVLTRWKSVTLPEGVYYEPIPTSNLQTGFYFYEVIIGNQKYSGKLLKL